MQITPPPKPKFYQKTINFNFLCSIFSTIKKKLPSLPRVRQEFAQTALDALKKGEVWLDGMILKGEFLGRTANGTANL